MKKIAIFVDWDNIRKGVFEHASQSLGLFVDYNRPENLLRLLTAFVESDEEIYRIFVYLSNPVRRLRFGDDIVENRAYERTKRFIETIASQPHVAVRMGKLKFRGYNKEGEPILIQKQVDMLIGLDIAHVSYTRLADRVLIFSFDTDMIPAMKVARINGLQVVLPSLPDINRVPKDMVYHADLIREQKFSEIFER